MPRNVTPKKTPTPEPPTAEARHTTEGIAARRFADDVLALVNRNLAQLAPEDAQTLLAVGCRTSDYDRKALVRILGKPRK